MSYPDRGMITVTLPLHRSTITRYNTRGRS
jgi:hypothetical protein